MAIIVDIFYALLLIAGWMAIIKYRRNVKSWTGNWMWAEKYIGNGWTYVVMILVGLFMIFFWVLYPFGGMEIITGWNTLNIAP